MDCPVTESLLCGIDIGYSGIKIQSPFNASTIPSIVVKEKNGVLTVQEENYFSGELKFVDGLPRTTKGDSDYHGFGTRSIRMIVNKYGGAFTAGAKDGVFSLTIVFVPDKDKKLQNK